MSSKKTGITTAGQKARMEIAKVLKRKQHGANASARLEAGVEEVMDQTNICVHAHNHSPGASK